MPTETTAAPPGKTDPHSGKLVYLEIGRALAALIVVLHHADQATAHFSDEARTRYFVWAQYGVDFFFVLSGFIIFHAHRSGAAGFFQARLYAFKRLCCTSRIGHEMTPTPDAVMPRQPRAPWSGTRAA